MRKFALALAVLLPCAAQAQQTVQQTVQPPGAATAKPLVGSTNAQGVYPMGFNINGAAVPCGDTSWGLTSSTPALRGCPALPPPIAPPMFTQSFTTTMTRGSSIFSPNGWFIQNNTSVNIGISPWGLNAASCGPTPMWIIYANGGTFSTGQNTPASYCFGTVSGTGSLVFHGN